jgi:transposase
MQRKGNIVSGKSQAENLVTVGVDMGGALWATAIRDWKTGRNSYYGLTDKDGKSKERQLYDKIGELVQAGHRVQVFYEAGRYGYAPARIMQSLGAEVIILPINKLKVIMCGKTIKTDKLDAKFLGGLHPDDQLPAVYIPTLEEEGRRDAERELGRLKSSIGRINAQLLAIIERTELKTPSGHRSSDNWRREISAWDKSGELKKLQKFMVLRLKNMVEELALAEKHLNDWQEIIDRQMEKDREEALKNNVHTTVDKLEKFKGIGDVISRHLFWEIGDFSRFKNGKKFSSYFGLTPCPFASGTMKREQGISKNGRKSLRKIAIELAWLWRRWQPQSKLTMKWEPFLKQKGRARKTAIVAMARQLMVALWRHVMYNEPIEGAIINKPLERA